MYNIDITRVADNVTSGINPQVSDFGDLVWEYEFSSTDTDIYFNTILDGQSIIGAGLNDEINPNLIPLNTISKCEVALISWIVIENSECWDYY